MNSAISIHPRIKIARSKAERGVFSIFLIKNILLNFGDFLLSLQCDSYRLIRGSQNYFLLFVPRSLFPIQNQ